MNRITLFTSLLFTVIAVNAQSLVQIGRVKTKGRMENSRHSPGKGLSGATIFMKGMNNIGVKNDDGSFSFNIQSKTFKIDSVKKKGYELVDVDVIRKSHVHSDEPFILLMEPPEQQIQDLLDAERIISGKYRERMRKALLENRKLKVENKISEEEYNRRIELFKESQKSSTDLIADIAKKYAQMDYDQMDDLNRQISGAILNGELTKADSMLRSKGDIQSRIAEIKKEQLAEYEEEKELIKRQEKLEIGKTGTKRKMEDMAVDLYKLFDIARLSNQFDSAAYYIELRAELDTTNAGWQYDAAYYYQILNQLTKAEFYYSKALKLYRQQSNVDNRLFGTNLAMTLNNLGVLYNKTNRMRESRQALYEALSIISKFEEDSITGSHREKAMISVNLANLLRDEKSWDESENYYKEALYIYRNGTDLETKENVAKTLNNISCLYKETLRLKECEDGFNEAIEIYRNLQETGSIKTKEGLATTMNNLASLLSDTQRLAKSEKLFSEALKIRRELAAQNPYAYNAEVATTLNDMAVLYIEKKKFSKSITMSLEALDIFNKLAEDTPSVYDPYIAMASANLSCAYRLLSQPKGSSYQEDALKIFQELARRDTKTYNHYMVMAMNNEANWCIKYDKEKCQELLTEGLDLLKREDDIYESDIAFMLNNLGVFYWGIHYRFINDYAGRLIDFHFKREMPLPSLNSRLQGELSPTLHGSSNQTIEMKELINELFYQAESILTKYVEMNDLKFEPYLAIVYGNHAGFCLRTGDKQKSEKLYKKMTDIRRRMAKRNPTVYSVERMTTINELM